MYVYYQTVGGHEPWLTQKVGLEFSEPLPTFVTVLATDIIINDSVPKDAVEKVRYMGDFYCDLDAADIEESIKGGQALYSKFQEYGLQEGDVRIFLSGKKGLHFLVPQQVFMDRVSPLQKLPAIYKEMAFTLAVDTMDFRVYTAKRGRMLRTCYNVRENGNYKVPITAQELKDLTAESYDRLCKAPRTVSVGEPKYRAKFAILFDTARQKVTRVKERKSKHVDAAALRRHMPTIQKILDGKASPDAGFNKIAMQLALYARDSGISPEQLVKDADGLLQHHQSDGYRYNTYAKRRHELIRMCEYVDDNPSYDFAIEPFLSLLPKPEAGDTKNDVHGGDSDDEGQVAHGGVVQRDGAYWALGGDAGDKLVLGAYFSNATVLHDRTHGSISCLMTEIVTPSGPKPVSVERADFASSSSLHKLCSAYGVSFMGSDIHARGIYELMLKSIEPNVYVTESEGLDVINIPSSQFELARKPFLIWADGKGVRVPQEITDLGIQIKFQGYPDPNGVIKTDLTNAPAMRQWLEEGTNRERMGRTLQSLFKCFPPDVIGKTVGWMVACFWRQLFHEGYGKFPIMHVNGVAGAGKCLGYGTPVIMHDGTIKQVQDIVAGDKLLGPDGGVRNVLITTSGRETLYKVRQDSGSDYVVNESHILSLRRGDAIVNIGVKQVFDSGVGDLRGWRACQEDLPNLTQITVEKLDVGDYYGFQLDGDSLFLLGDFTVTHNSEYTTSLLHFFYYNQEPRVLTPSSTPYSILATISGSASIPIVVDEYKPNEMPREVHHRLKLMFRDAYNKRETSRGGGNRTKDNYNALSVVQLSAPIAFVAEAMETETALLERSVIVTIKRQPTKVTTRTYRLFKEFYDNREILGIIGHNIAAHVTRTGTIDKLREEFDTIYNSARNEFLLQPGDEAVLTEEEIMKKSNMKERVVYNLSVASFGLSKLEQLLRAAFPNYSELFGEVMPTLHDGVFSRLDDSARNTLPEYLKVLLSMSDMTQLANDHPYVLVDGVEFVITEEGGFQTLNIVARMAYAKYRAWYRSQGQQPLFTNEDAFVHSLKDAPQFLRLGYGTAVLRTESVLLDYTALLRAGIPAYKGKPRAKT